jgi:hypothetical protein
VAVEQETVDRTAETGAYLAGLYMGIDEPYTFTGREGTDVVMKPAIRLLVGRSIVKVPYHPDTDPRALAVVVGAEKMDLVMLPVYAQGPWDEQARRGGEVKWQFRGPRVDGAG